MPPLRQQRGRETLTPLPPSKKKNPTQKAKIPMAAKWKPPFRGRSQGRGFRGVSGLWAVVPAVERGHRPRSCAELPGCCPGAAGADVGCLRSRERAGEGGKRGLGGYLCVKDCQGWKDENLLCSPRAPNFLPSRQLAGFL